MSDDELRRALAKLSRKDRRTVREALADAWEEGYYQGVRDNEFDYEPADNPWRNGD